MSSTTVFAKTVLQTKKKSKIKILFLVLGRIIKNNPLLFFFCALLAVITAIINFNIGVNFKNAFVAKDRNIATQIIKEIKQEDDKKEKEVKKERIKEIIEKKFSDNFSDEKQKKLKEVKAKIVKEISNEGKGNKIEKEKAKEIIEKNSTDSLTVRGKKDFKFKFIFFGWKFKRPNLSIQQFIFYNLLLIFVVKSFFSLLHYYLMSYSYDSVERDLKKDLFRHFIRAKYSNSSEISHNLITQFASDLDEIARSIWFIPNRLIYVAVSIAYNIIFDFSFGSGGINWEFIGILLVLFALLIVIEIILFKKAAKLSMEAKKRYEEDNKVIYERINNLEYIKAVSGEKYEEAKINKQLDTTFQKNKKSLWYSVLFKAFPNYVIIPNIPIFFAALSITFTSKRENDSVFLLANFARYYFTVSKLNSEINKIVDSLVALDDLSSNLTIVNESAKVLNQPTTPQLPTTPLKSLPFANGDIVFQEVVFAYPKRPHQDILRNFSFRFVRGKIYGIAGKNGIGKSTITKTTLKLYEIKKGQILIGQHNVQEIDTISLHQHICYQTNRPNFFRMSIAENIYYPNNYNKEDYNKLVQAAKKVGIYEFVKQLPQGFDTVLREGGNDLSEGQKQQISAIKIFINNYDIYILDEVLSNVHPDLKEVILKNIFTKLKGKTVLVIDHHYEIFQYVDYIYQFTGKELIKMDKKDFLSTE